MKYGIGALILVALLFAGYILVGRTHETPTHYTQETVSGVEPTGVVHSVVVTPDGYVPHTLTIAHGDAVEFSASDTYGQLHWPASNLHPSHGVYPAFDPKEPVEPTDTWTFVFDQIGEWRFHDHLAPYHTGVIIVN